MCPPVIISRANAVSRERMSQIALYFGNATFVLYNHSTSVYKRGVDGLCTEKLGRNGISSARTKTKKGWCILEYQIIQGIDHCNLTVFFAKVVVDRTFPRLSFSSSLPHQTRESRVLEIPLLEIDRLLPCPLGSSVPSSLSSLTGDQVLDW